MGRRKRSRHSPSPSASASAATPPPSASASASAATPPQLAGTTSATSGNALVLFETPSGFAIFSMDATTILLPDSIESIWTNFCNKYQAKQVVSLVEFQTFKDKSSAIKPTGLNHQLTEMILRYHCPGKIWAVGKLEYKITIEASLGITCLFDDNVMEVMWGLKRLMHILVPQEKSELGKEDRLQMSQGLNILFHRYGFENIKPEMVNDDIVTVAFILFDGELLGTQHVPSLLCAAKYLMDLSGIKTYNWDLIKIAIAMMLILYPEEKAIYDPYEMFTAHEVSKFKLDAHKYRAKLSKETYLTAFTDFIKATDIITPNLETLKSLVKKAKEAYEAK